MTIVEMCVHMDCSGCESKIRRALSKLRGVDNVEIDMARQKVTVTGWAEQKKVLRAARKTGRRAVLWPSSSSSPLDGEASGIYTEEYYLLHHNPSAPAPHHLIFNADPRSYNYYKHGYGGSGDAAAALYGHYQAPPPHNHIIDDGARVRFSDDNPNACSIM